MRTRSSVGCFNIPNPTPSPYLLQSSRAASLTSTALNAEEMSKSIPFLVRPDKLDGSMAGDLGFDPMRLSDIQADLKYARWSELKHGRICMLAIVGILVQQAGIHIIPGDQFTNTDVFGAPASVGWAGNLQVFFLLAAIELSSFYQHYGDGEPGDFGLDGGMLKNMSPDQVKYRKESEIVHCRLAMIAFVGLTVQTLLYGPVL
jgi:light-harvesting complex I chlorophyll a/b binding protein 1